jgi:hypothetical protein
MLRQERAMRLEDLRIAGRLTPLANQKRETRRQERRAGNR